MLTTQESNDVAVSDDSTVDDSTIAATHLKKQSARQVAPRPLIELKGISKAYGSGVTSHQVLTNINLNIREGEFLAICGFSGSGKTTLTQLIAGLIQPDSGEILMEGKPIAGPSPERGLVFQNYSLLPWLTVRGNIALSVDRVFRHWTKAERRDHIVKSLKWLVCRMPHIDALASYQEA